MKLSLVCASALAVAAFACGGSKAGDGPNGPLTFGEDPSSDGDAVVFLRGRSEGGRVYVDVVARGVNDVHGAAFRVKWDPGAIGFVEAKASPTWSKDAVVVAREAVPGQLLVAWSEKGGASGHDAMDATVLGTLIFDAKSRAGTPVSFRTERSRLVDHQGKPLTVTWRAGTVPAR